MPLKPFTCPLPETRFLHAGRLVYKFKIRCGSITSVRDLHGTGSAAKELEEAIRVVLGNLGQLHPFSTEHFTVFPYWSKWERVSKVRFRHENVPLVPYPYVCTLYLEPKSLQQALPRGKEVNKDGDELVCSGLKTKRKNEVLESTAVHEVVKRRVEVAAETSRPQPGVDGSRAECVHHMSKAEPGFEMNCPEEQECELSPASLSKGCNQGSSWEPVESDPEERTAAGGAETAMRLLQRRDRVVAEGRVESEGRGLSTLWRSKPAGQLLAEEIRTPVMSSDPAAEPSSWTRLYWVEDINKTVENQVKAAFAVCWNSLKTVKRDWVEENSSTNIQAKWKKYAYIKFQLVKQESNGKAHRDGEAFPLLNQSDVVKILTVKLGPALKIYSTLLMLKSAEDN